VWQRLGADVTNYIEPFVGSAAVLLKRPGWSPNVNWIETINDASGFIANFWRALQHDPKGVAQHADQPVYENDLHARHIWLVQNHKELLPGLLEGDPDYYDVKAAGWWVWGMACWIGSGFCSGDGPWQSVEMEDGSRRLIDLGDAGRGVYRKRVHLGGAGQGVQRRLVHLANAGQAGDGDLGLLDWMRALAERLRRVRICCGDWLRVCGPTASFMQGVTAVFLDPPYSAEVGRSEVYEIENMTVAHDCRRWAIEQGRNPLMRIALCGYIGEHDDELRAADWTPLYWKAHGGYGLFGNGHGRENRQHEVVWFSTHCLASDSPIQVEMFAAEDAVP